MPAQIADWSEVKATAISTGNLKRTAELHGLEHATVRMRASREKWPVGRRVHLAVQQAKVNATAQIVAASDGRVTSVTPASDALAEANAENSRSGRADLLRYGARAAKRLAEINPDEAIERAPQAASVAKVLSVAGDWQASSGRSLRIDIYAGVPERAVEGRVIEPQDCETTE